MKKRVLLLASSYMDIYKDIVKALNEKDYDVIWIEDNVIPYNPYNKSSKGVKTKTKEEFDEEVKAFWENEFKKPELTKPFDYFLAIDGMLANSFLFEKLRICNNNIKTILYLYDRIEGNYELDVFFKFYDSIFTFDFADKEKYELKHLPIYWVDQTVRKDDIYDIFGLASFSWGLRYDIYRRVKEIANKNDFKDYIRLWLSPTGNIVSYTIKYIVKKCMGLKMLSPKEIKNEIFTTKSLNPVEFREVICQSRVILDTQNPNQDGLTARCMWALGAEKKIITTNDAITKYPFYSKEQFYILKENNFDGIAEFISSRFTMTPECREIVKRYRIDNWIKTLLTE